MSLQFYAFLGLLCSEYCYYEHYDADVKDLYPGRVLPGFKLNWSYNVEVPFFSYFVEDEITQFYIRYCLNYFFTVDIPF